jgi:hypothetical protein
MTFDELLTIDDIRNNQQKVLDYLDRCFFNDSTVTLSNDDYIKKSVINRLSQLVLLSENVASINENSEELSRAMLRASLNEKDINFILNASLKISDISVSIKEAAAKSDGSSKEEEASEKANEMIKAKMESMGSIENLIYIIKESLGTSRILPVSSEEAIMEAMSQNLEPEKARKDMLQIERPVEFNLSFLDLNKLDNSQIFSFLKNMLSCDSNSSLELQLPIDALIDDIKTLYTIDLPNIAEQAVDFAKNSAKNSFSFTAERDAFQSLFDTL